MPTAFVGLNCWGVAPRDPAVKDFAASSLVQAYADALGSTVEAHPAQYFWWHRRFQGRTKQAPAP